MSRRCYNVTEVIFSGNHPHSASLRMDAGATLFCRLLQLWFGAGIRWALCFHTVAASVGVLPDLLCRFFPGEKALHAKGPGKINRAAGAGQRLVVWVFLVTVCLFLAFPRNSLDIVCFRSPLRFGTMLFCLSQPFHSASVRALCVLFLLKWRCGLPVS
jgi:hypothetical protein